MFLAHMLARFTPVGGQDRNQPLPYDPSLPVPEQIAESFAKSLKNLRTTYIDSYVLHSPLETTARTLQAWRTLAALKADGRVRQIGLSNTYDVETLAMLEQETGATVEVVQNRWFERNNFDKEVWNVCHERGTQYQCALPP
jgi:aryl-alcohol dehydrogenase-like predicted oxidoreductase